MTKYVFRVHALRRMVERRVSDVDVRGAVENGEVIEDYPDDIPYPSQLILAHISGRPLHVVIARNADADEVIVITVYEPDPEQWDDEFKRRQT